MKHKRIKENSEINRQITKPEKFIEQSCLPSFLMTILLFCVFAHVDPIVCRLTDLGTSFKYCSPHKRRETFHGKLCHGLAFLFSKVTG